VAVPRRRLHALPRSAFPRFFSNVRFKPWKTRPAFLTPPASRANPAAADRLAFLRPHLSDCGGKAAVQGQCNGLVLCFQVRRGGDPSAGFVCNPTTERWARLPDRPTPWPRGHEGVFLVFDPAVSPEYETLHCSLFHLLDRETTKSRRLQEKRSRVSVASDAGNVSAGIVSEETAGGAEEEREAAASARLLVSDGAVEEAAARSPAEEAYTWARTWWSTVYRRGSAAAR
jgi:hypothetical protein